MSNRYLNENFAPVGEEITAFDLPVTGTIPEELAGRWLRNGPNPIGHRDPDTYHWFTGDGMVHGVRLKDGRAEWYRNRWVRSDQVADALGESATTGPQRRDDDLGPNTSVGGFAGRTWAMVEAGWNPVELDYELNTVSRSDFDGTLPSGFSAHPKYDRTTRELHAMVYSYPDVPNHLTYVVVGPDARVSRTVEVPVEGMPMVHDISITEDWVVVYDLPVAFDLDRLVAGRLPFSWQPERTSRVGLLPRQGTAADIVWCDAPTAYVFHPVNAFDDNGKVVVDVCRYSAIFNNDQVGPFGDELPTLARWTIDPAAQKVDETVIDDGRSHEFPRHNPRVGMRDYRYAYTAAVAPDAPSIHPTIHKVDLTTGAVEERDFGVGRGGQEPIFIPRTDGVHEDDGWVMTVVYDANEECSELAIIDAADFAAPPVATIELPQRVPYGFHGDWVSDASVAPPS